MVRIGRVAVDADITAITAQLDPDTAERCLGHVIRGVRGVYDQHDYQEEKLHAFEKLAAQIERIVNPPGDNVVALNSARRRAGG